MKSEERISADQLQALGVECRSCRRFLQESVRRQDIMQMLEAVRACSCGMNAQSVRVVAVTDPQTVAAMQGMVKWAAQLPPGVGAPKKGQQPTAFLVLSLAGGYGAYADVDLGIAVEAIVMMARAQGYGSCIMGAIDIPKIRELLQIPEEEKIRLAIALGRPAQKSFLEEPADGDLHYHFDEQGNNHVPRRPVSEIARFV